MPPLNNSIERRIQLALQHYFPKIELVLIFGSHAAGKASVESDWDIAIAGKKRLSYAKRIDITNALARLTEREVDVIDLQAVSGVILEQALGHGKILIKKNKTLYANLLKKMLYNQADMMPLYHEMLRVRRDTFLKRKFN